MFSRRELAKIVAGAAVGASSIPALADTQPKDTITQREIASLFHLETTKDIIAVSFRRRLALGAAIEPGPYQLRPTNESVEEVEEDLTYSSAFNCPGFNRVAFVDRG